MRATVASLAGLLGLALLAACGDKASDDDDDDDDGGIGSGSGSGSGSDSGPDDSGNPDECVGSAPVVVELGCKNGGMQDYEGTQTPTFTFSAEATDADGDLHGYVLTTSYDSSPDGVLSGAVDLGQSTGSVGAECEVYEADLGVTWFIDGGTLQFDGIYDFGITVEDSHGYVSEAAVITCQLPASSGLGGGEVDL